MNILAGGRVPIGVANFIAGGSHTALIKSDGGSPLDICPIAVGEALRRLTGKCLCIISRVKASELFGPFQLGVACPAGAEKLVHDLRRCITEHWEDDDLVACKIDLKNAFNEVSQQTLLEECATHFPELFRWVFLVLWTTPHLVALHGHLWIQTWSSAGRPFGSSPFL